MQSDRVYCKSIAQTRNRVRSGPVRSRQNGFDDLLLIIDTLQRHRRDASVASGDQGGKTRGKRAFDARLRLCREEGNEAGNRLGDGRSHSLRVPGMISRATLAILCDQVDPAKAGTKDS